MRMELLSYRNTVAMRLGMYGITMHTWAELMLWGTWFFNLAEHGRKDDMSNEFLHQIC